MSGSYDPSANSHRHGLASLLCVNLLEKVIKSESEGHQDVISQTGRHYVILLGLMVGLMWSVSEVQGRHTEIGP